MPVYRRDGASSAQSHWPLFAPRRARVEFGRRGFGLSDSAPVPCIKREDDLARFVSSLVGTTLLRAEILLWHGLTSSLPVCLRSPGPLGSNTRTGSAALSPRS